MIDYRLLRLSLPLILWISLSTPTRATAASRPLPWQAGVSVFTESGDFGTGSDTIATYIPFSLRRTFSRGDVKLIIPYLTVRTEGDVTLISGMPNATEEIATTRSRETHSGLGDIVLKGRYYLLEEGRYTPQLDIVPKIKFPTGSRSEFLGSGEFDEGIALEGSRILAKRYLALGSVGYTLIGDPPGQNLRNQWDYSVGAGYYLIPYNWEASLLYEERRALTPGRTNPRDLFFYTAIKATPRIRMHAGVEVGLSRTAADYGVEVGARTYF